MPGPQPRTQRVKRKSCCVLAITQDSLQVREREREKQGWKEVEWEGIFTFLYRMTPTTSVTIWVPLQEDVSDKGDQKKSLGT